MSAIVDTLLQTLRSAPHSWQFRLALVEALVAEGRTGEARTVLDEAGDWPSDPESQTKAARAFGLLEPAEGIRLLEPILQADPSCAAAHFEKAFLSLRSGDHQIAKRHYFTALTFDPSLEHHRFEQELNQAALSAPTPPEATRVRLAETAPAAGSEPEWDDETPLPVVALEPGPEFASERFPLPPDVSDTAVTLEVSPGNFPVQSLRDALETGSIRVRSLVRPDALPPLPTLVHSENTFRHNLAYAKSEADSRDLHNVYVHPPTRENPVVYDYQHPDDSIFEPVVTPDEIYVVYPEPDSDQSQNNTLGALIRNRRQRDFQIARQRRRNKVGAAFTGIIIMGFLTLILWMIKLALPIASPPEIVATTTSAVTKTLPKRVIQVRQANPTPTAPSAAAPATMEVITSATASAVAVPNFDSPDSVDLQLGTSFGSGAGFGSAPGSGNSGTFFGTKVTGGMAVIFDITASMYSSNPLVVAEINRRFKSSQVVAVFGATFRDVGGGDLVPYKRNQDVLANVDKNGKKSPTQLAMNKALFSLNRCDSLSSNGWEIQSLGKAIEALLGQPLDRQPKTIFVFSDFQDGIDLAYMEKVQELVKRRRVKVVFYHPVAFGRDKTHYINFAKATGGEVKEGLPK